MTEETTTEELDQTSESPEVTTEEDQPQPETSTAPDPSQEASEDSGSTTEQVEKPTDSTTPDTEQASSEEPTVDRVVPELDSYVLPEGMPKEVAEFAKDADMTQEQLDKTLAQFAKITQGSEEHRQAEIRSNGEKLLSSWGSQSDYNMSIVKRALKQNDPDGRLLDLMNESGYGNHPAVLSFFLSVGNSMKEGGFLKGSNNSQTKKGQTAATAMFGNSHPSNN